MEGPTRLVIYGNGRMAEFAWARFGDDERFVVAGFTVDGASLRETRLRGLSVVPFEEVERHFSPAEHRMFIAVGPIECNRVRAARFDQAKKMGYLLADCISPRAMIARGVTIGENVSIGDGAVIQSFVSLGNNVHVGAACVIGHHSVVQDHCFLAPGCIVSGAVGIGERSFLGAGATVRDRLQIAPDCIVGAGATIVRDTAPSSVQVAPEAVVLPIDSSQVRL